MAFITIKNNSNQLQRVTTPFESFHQDKLAKDLQQLNIDDQLLDCTIATTKDNQEIKVYIFTIRVCNRRISFGIWLYLSHFSGLSTAS